MIMSAQDARGPKEHSYYVPCPLIVA
jgi:hypothetical protein